MRVQRILVSSVILVNCAELRCLRGYDVLKGLHWISVLNRIRGSTCFHRIKTPYTEGACDYCHEDCHNSGDSHPHSPPELFCLMLARYLKSETRRELEPARASAIPVFSTDG